MKLNNNEAFEMQWILVEYLRFHDETPLFLFGDRLPNVWQFAVDTTYRLLTCNLVELYPEDILIKNDDFSFNGIWDYCCELAKQNPRDYNTIFDKPCAWSEPLICLTQKGIDLIERYFSQLNSPLFSHEVRINVDFIEELEFIFDKHNVGIKPGEVLIPISSQQA